MSTRSTVSVPDTRQSCRFASRDMRVPRRRPPTRGGGAGSRTRSRRARCAAGSRPAPSGARHRARPRPRSVRRRARGTRPAARSRGRARRLGPPDDRASTASRVVIPPRMTSAPSRSACAGTPRPKRSVGCYASADGRARRTNHRFRHRAACPCTRLRPRRLRPGDASRRAGRSSVHARASTRRCTAGACGRCASTPGLGTAAETNERFRYLLEQGQTGLRWRSTCRRRWASTRTIRAPRARSARSAWRSTRSRTWSGCSTDPARPGLDVDDDQRDGGDPAAALRAGGRGAGRRTRRAIAAPSRTTS